MASVSVIIPTYNRASWIGQTLESALAQRAERLEVVVVDDGSRDGTRAVVKQYGERITYLYQENRGVAGARNTGLRASHGDYVVFLDDDDKLYPGMVATAVSALEANPQYDAVYGRGVNVDLEGRELSEYLHAGISGDVFPAVVRGHTFQFAQLMFRRSSLSDRYPFDEALRFGDDFKFFLEYTRVHQLLYVPQPFLRKTTHPGMETRSKAQGDAVKRRLQIIEELFGEEAAQIKRRYLGRRAIADWYRSDGFVKAEAKDMAEARRLILESLGQWPLQPTLYVWLAAQAVPPSTKARVRRLVRGRRSGDAGPVTHG